MTETEYQPGSRADFDRLYAASYERMLHTLLGVLRDRAAAEDCTQEAFVRAYQAWPRWKPDAPAEAWLHRIALNAAISYRRREGLRSLGQTVLHPFHPSKDSTDTDAGNDLLAALRRMPPLQAGAIVLRYHHGYSNREIAAALGVAESTVASRIAAAKERLRRELGGSDGEVAEAASRYFAPQERSI